MLLFWWLLTQKLIMHSCNHHCSTSRLHKFLDHPLMFHTNHLHIDCKWYYQYDFWMEHSRYIHQNLKNIQKGRKHWLIYIFVPNKKREISKRNQLGEILYITRDSCCSCSHYSSSCCCLAIFIAVRPGIMSSLTSHWCCTPK